MSGKVVPIGGKHKSAQSMLAELQSDENIEKFIIVTFLKDGTPEGSYFKMSLSEMAYAALLIQKDVIDMGAIAADGA